MSLIFIDGFDHYSIQIEKWDTQTVSNSDAAITQEVGRFTPGALALGAATPSIGGKLTKRLSDSTEAIVGFAVFAASSGNYKMRLQNQDGSAIGSIVISSPDITLLNAAGTVVATALSVTTANTWQFIEFRVRQSSTLGEIELRVDGLVVASAINLNTGTKVINEFVIDNQFNSDNKWIDDLYILDTTGDAPQNTFLGDTRVTVLRPKANGNVNNFTPTGAVSNFDAVNEELANQDTDFVEAGQLGAKDDYDNADFADLGIAPGAIYGVQVVNSTSKTDAGRLDYLDQMIIAGTTYDKGTSVIASAVTYKMTTFLRDTDPSDNAAWTEAKVAAVGSGFEITFREV